MQLRNGTTILPNALKNESMAHAPERESLQGVPEHAHGLLPRLGAPEGHVWNMRSLQANA